MKQPSYEQLIDLLARALPYVEEAAGEEIYSAAGRKRIRMLCRQLETAVRYEELRRPRALKD